MLFGPVLPIISFNIPRLWVSVSVRSNLLKYLIMLVMNQLSVEEETRKENTQNKPLNVGCGSCGTLRYLMSVLGLLKVFHTYTWNLVMDIWTQVKKLRNLQLLLAVIANVSGISFFTHRPFFSPPFPTPPNEVIPIPISVNILSHIYYFRVLTYFITCSYFFFCPAFEVKVHLQFWDIHPYKWKRSRNKVIDHW